VELEGKVVAVKVGNFEKSGVGGQFGFAEGKNGGRGRGEKVGRNLLAVGSEGVDVDELDEA
jgi:hypothetical protein